MGFLGSNPSLPHLNDPDITPGTHEEAVRMSSWAVHNASGEIHTAGSPFLANMLIPRSVVHRAALVRIIDDFSDSLNVFVAAAYRPAPAEGFHRATQHVRIAKTECDNIEWN